MDAEVVAATLAATATQGCNDDDVAVAIDDGNPSRAEPTAATALRPLHRALLLSLLLSLVVVVVVAMVVVMAAGLAEVSRGALSGLGEASPAFSSWRRREVAAASWPYLWPLLSSLLAPPPPPPPPPSPI